MTIILYLTVYFALFYARHLAGWVVAMLYALPYQQPVHQVQTVGMDSAEYSNEILPGDTSDIPGFLTERCSVSAPIT